MGIVVSTGDDICTNELSFSVLAALLIPHNALY